MKNTWLMDDADNFLPYITARSMPENSWNIHFFAKSQREVLKYRISE